MRDPYAANRRGQDAVPTADLRPTVCSARSALTSLAETLERRGPLVRPASTSGLFGTWSTGQDALLDVIAAVEAIRVNTKMVPQSLRSFLS